MHSGTRTAPLSEGAEEDSFDDAAPPEPGVVAVFSGRAIGVPFVHGRPVGREALAELGVKDDQMSREHFELRADKRGLTLDDLKSRNGTFFGGARISSPVPVTAGDVVRAGRTLFVVVDDARSFERAPPRLDGDEVRGPELTKVLARAQAMSQLEQLLVVGESGSGKEHVARAFHGGDAKAPFVALNCASLQGGIVERLLFGARKGVYTGAEADAEGYVRAAEGGTLFLDEIAELDAAVQAKLLRFVETREYFPLGDTRPRTAKVRICFATLKGLEVEVEAHRFREDLFHRIATPIVHVPPLRERRAEIPLLIELEVRRHGGRVKPTIGFVESALRSPWPGNVRQLRRTVVAALVAAELEGRTTVGASDLPLVSANPAPAPAPEPAPEAEAAIRAQPTDEEIERAVEAAAGNVSVAARALGIHRSKLRRWLERKR